MKRIILFLGVLMLFTNFVFGQKDKQNGSKENKDSRIIYESPKNPTCILYRYPDISTFIPEKIHKNEKLLIFSYVRFPKDKKLIKTIEYKLAYYYGKKEKSKTIFYSSKEIVTKKEIDISKIDSDKIEITLDSTVFLNEKIKKVIPINELKVRFLQRFKVKILPSKKQLNN